MNFNINSAHNNNNSEESYIITCLTSEEIKSWKSRVLALAKSKRKEIEERLKDDNDELSLVIVRDMWLAGFDVPFLHTMYVANIKIRKFMCCKYIVYVLQMQNPHSYVLQSLILGE